MHITFQSLDFTFKLCGSESGWKREGGGGEGAGSVLVYEKSFAAEKSLPRKITHSFSATEWDNGKVFKVVVCLWFNYKNNENKHSGNIISGRDIK